MNNPMQIINMLKGIKNPKEAIMFVIDYVDKNNHILNCAYDSMGRDEMKRFFHSDFYNLIFSIKQLRLL